MAAKTCIFDHINAGLQSARQNIAMDTATENPTDAINSMFDRWYNEYPNCNMDQIKKISTMTGSNGKTFGHFTQVVMANSMKIGCGMVNYLQGSRLYSRLVCNYAQTNMWGWPTLGTTCCESGCSSTYPGLCNPGEVVTW
ncbi:hypothetical protein HA402_014929 [Bradysia odoriphaga]|nr:hypothetical protein HA402_014929 [Bradysia odoriphaga]